MKYFSAANTPCGFINYFNDSIDIDNASQILYIKGGSGIGKSTLMRSIERRAKDNGHEAIEIYCSSDPKSLDGIVIDDIGIAVFDATMPHISDPLYPRAGGKIVDLGIFLDEGKLKGQKEDLIYLTHKKKSHYNTLYSLLSTLKKSEEVRRSLVYSDRLRLKSIREEIISIISNDSPIQHTRRGFMKALDRSDIVDFTSSLQGQFISITSSIDIIALDLVDDIGRMLDFDLLPYDSFFSIIEPYKVETLRTSSHILTASSRVGEGRIYSLDDVINIKNRHAYDTLLAFREDILSLATEEINEARITHEEIESIYKDAMDFDALNEYELKLIEDLFTY